MRKSFGVLAAVSTAIGVLLAPVGANAEIFVSPIRQVITEDAPAARYEVSNPSNRIIDLKVSWIDLELEGEGYKPASADFRTAHSAAPFLEVSPARLSLKPGARAEITVRLRDKRRLPRTERRSHLLFETGANRTPLRKAGGGLQADVGLGVSTPVLIRPGLAKAEARFADTRLLRDQDGLLEISTSIERKGPASAYGRLEARLREEGENTPRLVAVRENIAVFADTPSRLFTLPLGEDLLPGGSVLTLEYIGSAEYQGTLFATKSFEIAPPQ
jgi:hypothetical protein